MEEEVEFGFRKEDSNLFGKIYRPVARLTLIHGSHRVPSIFYVDSGADITLIPRSVGEVLGFRPLRTSQTQEIKGLGENGIPIVVKKVTMQLGEKTFPARIAWSLVEEVPLLLGRMDVFSLFDILFQRNRSTFFRSQP